MNKKQKNLWLLATVVFAMALTTFLLSDIVLHPWHVVTELGADGGKNNYTFLYQVLYGKGGWFMGMNYPYGEHIVYTDGQPIFSVPLSYIKSSMTIGRALSIMWWLISLSYVLSVIYLFKLLSHFGVKPLIAMVFAGLIVAFSPQVFRIAAHYALSYACVIPMLFYWTVLYYETSRKKYAFFVFLCGVFTSFLHPYFAAVILIWVALYAVGYLLLHRTSVLRSVRHIVPLVLAVAGIFIIFGTIMRITDPMRDRPSTPYGILVNCTHLLDIVTSLNTPLWTYFKGHNIFIHTTSAGEGYTYIGMAMLVVLAVSLVLGITGIVRKRPAGIMVSETGFQPLWLFIAFSALLFSMGAPFTWHMEWLLDYASALRQFRTLGRFAWIFYYIVTVYGAIAVYKWYAAQLAAGRRPLAYAILLLPMLVWGYEASGYAAFARETAARGYDNFDHLVSAREESWPQFLAAHHYAPDAFQASIVLRFFEVGSEKLWLGRDVSMWGMANGLKAGLQLHLPMVDCMMSRTSWKRAFEQARIAGGPFTDKPLLRDITSNKPFLLLCVDMEPIEPDQAYLIQASDSIGHYGDCSVYACYPDRIRANDQKNVAAVTTAAAAMGVGDSCLHNTGQWFAQHFDTVNGNCPRLFGSGAMPFEAVNSKVVSERAFRPVYDQQLYELSAWFLVPGDDYKSAYCTIFCLDSARQQVLRVDALTKEATDNKGLWLRDHVYFRVPGNTRFIRVTTETEGDHSYLSMDELLLMPADALIISKAADGSILANNHLIKQK